MRSFNRKMPEEINRVVTDHISEKNFCSTELAIKNLETEGRGYTAILVGDVMYDCAMKFLPHAEKNCDPFQKYGVEKKNYILLTSHRPANTDNRERLTNIIKAANELSEKYPVLYPVHPRAKAYLEKYDLKFSENVKVLPPMSYFEMILAEKYAKLIMTDSGGMQKEAFFHEVPCITMRDETEWLETIESGWNIIVGADYHKIMESANTYLSSPPLPVRVKPYGDGNAAEKIVKHLSSF
jgi:UDP-GlcNAc3NAcA epimerase